MPNIRQLANKPLVEAILELRWRVSQEQGDPHYALFPGRLYDCVESEYPFQEALPTSLMPQPISQGIVQHRFRSSENSWPLIQVGPGIVTLNETDGYRWTSFGRQAKAIVDNTFKAYPKPASLEFTSLMLRYINAIETDYKRTNIFAFLADKLEAKIELPSKLFDDVPIGNVPVDFNLQTSYPVHDPEGVIAIRFATGTHKDQPALIWETRFRSQGNQLPQMPDGFGEWVEAAHTLTDDWFFKLIEGELERRFAGDQ